MLYYQKRDANGLQICFLIPHLKEDLADYNHGEHVFPPWARPRWSQWITVGIGCGETRAQVSRCSECQLVGMTSESF